MAAAFLAMLGIIGRLYQDAHAAKSQAGLAAARFVLDEADAAASAAVERLSLDPMLTRLAKEEDPFRFVVAFNHRLRDESLDFGYFIRDAAVDRRPWVEGSSLRVFKAGEQDAFLARLMPTEEPSNGFLTLATAGADAAALYTIHSKILKASSRVLGFYVIGRRLAPDARLQARMQNLMSLPSDGGAAFAVRLPNGPAMSVGDQRFFAAAQPTTLMSSVDEFSQPLAGTDARLVLISDRRPLSNAILKVTGMAVIGVAMLILIVSGFFAFAMRNARLQQINAEAQLFELKAQMQPHFLFNALNSIGQMMRSDVSGARAMIDHLARLFRRILATAVKPTAPLAAEIEIAHDYLALQKMRYSDRLDFSIHVRRPDAASIAFPCLMLQTLIENGIKHGIETSLEGGRIDVDVTTAADGRLAVTVINDGAPLGEPVKFGTGLTNTVARLRVLYGDHFEFSLSTNADRRTEARLLLPVRNI